MSQPLLMWWLQFHAERRYSDGRTEGSGLYRREATGPSSRSDSTSTGTQARSITCAHLPSSLSPSFLIACKLLPSAISISFRAMASKWRGSWPGFCLFSDPTGRPVLSLLDA